MQREIVYYNLAIDIQTALKSWNDVYYSKKRDTIYDINGYLIDLSETLAVKYLVSYEEIQSVLELCIRKTFLVEKPITVLNGVTLPQSYKFCKVINDTLSLTKILANYTSFENLSIEQIVRFIKYYVSTN